MASMKIRYGEPVAFWPTMAPAIVALLDRTCSSAWAEAQVLGRDRCSKRGGPIYPPPADSICSRMVVCRICRRPTPAMCVDMAGAAVLSVDAIGASGTHVARAVMVDGRWECWMMADPRVRQARAALLPAVRWLRFVAGRSQLVFTYEGTCLDCYCGLRAKAQDAYGASSFHTAMEMIRTNKVRLKEARVK